MWGDQNKVWTNYENDLLAADKQSAVFLQRFINQMRLHKAFIPYFELVDLQHYKIIKKKTLINSMLYKVNKVPFIFLAGKN